MRRGAVLAVVVALLGCSGSQPNQAPGCSPPGAVPMASEACLSQPDVVTYQEELAEAVADQLRWRHTPDLPIEVEFERTASVHAICTAPRVVALPWGMRRQLARANAALRGFRSGPACLAATRLDLTAALVELSVRAPKDMPSLGSCLTLRDSICIEQDSPVCGVFPDGTTRTYRNACQACENTSLAGWLEGPCGLR